VVVRMSMRSIRELSAATRPSRPSRSRTAMPLACTASAAPTSDGRSDRSTSVT
jgi:hypothetical protein